MNVDVAGAANLNSVMLRSSQINVSQMNQNGYDAKHWVERFDYKEAGPQLLPQAFLQRIINSGGRIEREYGLGRKQTGLLSIWNCPGSVGGVQRVVLELKVGSGASEVLIREGLEQTADYMDRRGADESHLVIFDRNPNRTDLAPRRSPRWAQYTGLGNVICGSTPLVWRTMR